MLKNTKGFTLVEVAVVMVILAILAGLTIPNISSWVRDSQENRLISEAKVAVKTAKGIANKAYISDNSYKLKFLLAGSNVMKESGLKGEIYGIEVGGAGDKQNEILHLSYRNYDETVTYCAHAGNCTTSKNASKHTEEYNFIDGEHFIISSTEKDPEDNSQNENNENNENNGNDGDGDGGNDSGNDNTPSDLTTMDGFWMLDANGEFVFVPALDAMAEFQYLKDNPLDVYGNVLWGFNPSDVIISIEHNGKIRYFYVRPNGNPSLSTNMTKEQLLNTLINDSNTYEIPEPVLVPHDSNIQPGQICYHTSKETYTIFAPWEKDWKRDDYYLPISFDPAIKSWRK